MFFYFNPISVVATAGCGPITDEHTSLETTANDTMSLSDSETAFIAFISMFLISSFFSNVSVVVVMMKIKTLRMVTNTFQSKLAISDMFLTALVLPQQVHDVSPTDEYFERKLHVAFSWLLYTVRKNQTAMIETEKNPAKYRNVPKVNRPEDNNNNNYLCILFLKFNPLLFFQRIIELPFLLFLTTLRTANRTIAYNC